MSAGFPNVLCAVVTVDCTLLRCSAALYLTALYTSRSGYYDISNMHINISPCYTHGREWSRDMDTALWYAETDHVTWILYTSRSTMTYQTCTSYLRVPMWEPDPVLHNSRKQWIRFWYYFESFIRWDKRDHGVCSVSELTCSMTWPVTSPHTFTHTCQTCVRHQMPS